MGGPISSWHQIPPEYRQRVKQALREFRTPAYYRRLWFNIVITLILIVVCLAMLWHARTTGFGSPAGYLPFWLIFPFWSFFFTPATIHEEAVRFAQAVRSVGLEAAEPPPPKSWRQRWHDFAPPAKGQVDRDWSWVRHRRQLVLARIGPGLMWRYKEEMYRRRFRVLLPVAMFLLMLCYLIPMALFSAPIYPFISYFIVAFVIALFIGWIAFYFIHESWRPTWAALNSLGAPTCMRCGYDLTHHEQQTCPECGAPPGEEVVWSEPAVQPQAGPQPAIVRSVAPPPK